MSEQDEALDGLISEAVAAFGERTWTVGLGADKSQLPAHVVTTANLAKLLLEVKIGEKGTGTIWSPFEFKTGRRLGGNATHADLMAFDIDLGYQLDDITSRLDLLGWAAIISPSPSHGKTQSQEVQQWRHTAHGADVTHFMVEDGWMMPWLAETITETKIVQVNREAKKADGTTRTTSTDYINVTHAPRPKFRVVLPLAKPWRTANYNTPGAAFDAWENAYLSTADALGLTIDESTKDTSRLFYVTRVSADREALARQDRRVLAGEAFDPFSLPAPKPRQPLHLPLRKPGSRLEALNTPGSERRVWNGYNLVRWAANHADTFEIAEALRNRGEILTDDRANKPGQLHIACPYEDEHTSEANGGTVAVNASATESGGFRVYCQHKACQTPHPRDRLEFLAAMLEQGNLLVEDVPGLSEATEVTATVEDFADAMPDKMMGDEIFGDPQPKEIRELPILAFRECRPDLFRIDLIKGVLGREGLSVLYGDSNVGKTFVALDLAFHIATGKPWRGRRVEQGVVVYVAAEGGNGIQNRIAALKIKHGVEDADLFVIPASVDMLRPDADCGAIINAIRKIEAMTGKKVKFVVIDTLSRALAGGNENDSTDMGSFVRNCDRLRHAARTHLMVVHHNGKDAAKGARGHSSLRAAIDTEIEVADGVISFVKQRDMEAGAPVGFQLEIVDLGTDAYGESVSSCVVGQAAVATEEERVAEVRISPQAKTLFRVFKEMWEDGEGGELNFISVDKWCLGVVKRRQNGDEALVSLPSEKKLLKQAIRRACLKLVEAKLLKNIVEDQWFM